MINLKDIIKSTEIIEAFDKTSESLRKILERGKENGNN